MCDVTNELSGIWFGTPGRRWAHFLATLPPDEPADATVLAHGEHLHDMVDRTIYARNLLRSVRFLTLPQHFSLNCDDIYPDQSAGAASTMASALVSCAPIRQ
jgi:hypothetical protein